MHGGAQTRKHACMKVHYNYVCLSLLVDDFSIVEYELNEELFIPSDHDAQLLFV